MALSARKQTFYWGSAAVLFLFVFWALDDVLLPFIIGSAIAYLLDPVVDRFEAMGLSRTKGVLLVSLAALILLLPLALFVLNVLVTQVGALASISLSPEKITEIEKWLVSILPAAIGENIDLQETFEEIAAFIRPKAETLFQGLGKSLLGALLSSAMSLVNIIILIVVVPVVTIYMLLDWDKMIARIDALLPRDHANTIRVLTGEIDRTLAAFVRGMGSVCFILATYYAVSLWMVGLSFGVAVGFFAGLVTFIPYLGSIIGGALAIGLGIFEFWGDWNKLAIVAGIFFLGQVIEGNYLTPKLVGESVGLHPVWLLLALSAFGTLFGFVGMLIAVPVAASIGVLVRFGTDQYTAGYLYKGAGSEDDAT